MRLEGATATHVGMLRDINQDRVHYAGRVAAVADGMGGHVGGERAAAVAIERIGLLEAENAAELLESVLESANEAVLEASIEEGLQGMGTTMVALALNDQQGLVRVVNVGDSRGYLYRGGQLSQVTVDHSLVQDLVTSGQLDPADAEEHPQKNIVTRALGIDVRLDVDTFDVAAQDNDLFLLCSDGLSNEVDLDELTNLLGEANGDLDSLAQKLVDTAAANGGRDNISVALARVVAEEGDTFDPLAVPFDEASGGDSLLGDDPARFESGTLAGDSSAAVVIDVPSTIADSEKLDRDQTGHASDQSSVADLDVEPSETTAAGGQSRVDIEAARSPELSPLPQRKRRSRSGMFAFFFTLVAVVAVAFGSASWYGRNAWFADTESGQVVIFQGRPDGFLWIEPDRIESTDVLLNDLNGEAQDRLSGRPTWPSLTAAREFVGSLELTPEAESARSTSSGS